MSLCHVAIATLWLNRERVPLSQIKTSRLLERSLPETVGKELVCSCWDFCIAVVCALGQTEKRDRGLLEIIDFIYIYMYVCIGTYIFYICVYIYKEGRGMVVVEGQVCQQRR